MTIKTLYPFHDDFKAILARLRIVYGQSKIDGNVWDQNNREVFFLLDTKIKVKDFITQVNQELRTMNLEVADSLDHWLFFKRFVKIRIKDYCTLEPATQYRYQLKEQSRSDKALEECSQVWVNHRTGEVTPEWEELETVY